MTDEHGDQTEQPRDERSSGGSSGPDWGLFVRNTLLVLVLLGLVWVVLNVELPSVDGLRSRLAYLGWAAWIGFVALYAVVAITPIPVTVMALTAGVLFGVLAGSILSVIGVLIGCWGAYWLARGLGRNTVGRLLGRHSTTVEKRLSNAGFEAVYMLRLMPGLPYWPVNYGSGAFGVSQRDYVIASGMAAIPGQVSLVAVGAFLSDPSIVNGIVVVSAWAVVVVMTIWAYRSWKGTSTRELPGKRLRGR